MKIVDLVECHHSIYFKCLEDWSSEIAEAGDHKETWYLQHKDSGLRVKLAVDDEGTVGGMIQYLPIEQSFVLGEDLYFIMCVWVHGHKKGRGNFQRKGMGSALLQAAEDDARQLGAKGMAAWGVWLPFWMKASWFKKHGYRKADRDFIRMLLFKPFCDDAPKPRFLRQERKPAPIDGQVTVTSFLNGWCPAMNLAHERSRRACAEFGDKVVFRTIDTKDRAALHEWGMCDGLFVDGKSISLGPPPSYEKIRKVIARRVRKL